MVKIKTKKQFTKKELVKYLLEQKNVEVEFDECDFNLADKTTTITPAITGNFNLSFNYNENCLELEVEEEVTEETKVPLLLEVYPEFYGDNLMGDTSKNACIADRYDSHSIAFHMVHPDGTITLLWTKEGGMQ